MPRYLVWRKYNTCYLGYLQFHPEGVPVDGGEDIGNPAAVLVFNPIQECLRRLACSESLPQVCFWPCHW